jgi:hypothetical protein
MLKVSHAAAAASLWAWGRHWAVLHLVGVLPAQRGGRVTLCSSKACTAPAGIAAEAHRAVAAQSCQQWLTPRITPPTCGIFPAEHLNQHTCVPSSSPEHEHCARTHPTHSMGVPGC